MKTLLALIALFVAPAIGQAAVYLDYRLVSLEELSSMGVRILAFSAANRTSVTVKVSPADKRWIVRVTCPPKLEG